MWNTVSGVGGLIADMGNAMNESCPSVVSQAVTGVGELVASAGEVVESVGGTVTALSEQAPFVAEKLKEVGEYLVEITQEFDNPMSAQDGGTQEVASITLALCSAIIASISASLVEIVSLCNSIDLTFDVLTFSS